MTLLKHFVDTDGNVHQVEARAAIVVFWPDESDARPQIVALAEDEHELQAALAASTHTLQGLLSGRGHWKARTAPSEQLISDGSIRTWTDDGSGWRLSNGELWVILITIIILIMLASAYSG